MIKALEILEVFFKDEGINNSEIIKATRHNKGEYKIVVKDEYDDRYEYIVSVNSGNIYNNEGLRINI